MASAGRAEATPDSAAIGRGARPRASTAEPPLQSAKDRLKLESVPEEERGRYHTLSGMLMLLTGRLPKVADEVSWEGWRLEIVDMDGKAIDKVLATRAVLADEPASSAASPS